MVIEESAKKELLDSILKVMVTPNARKESHSEDDEKKFCTFIKSVNMNKQATVQLPLDFALKHEMFDLVKSQKVFIENSVKFTTTFSTKKPTEFVKSVFNARYVGNEFKYSFLDNHPGIINVDKLKDIPIDYEGLMAVPSTILEYKNLARFNIHRVLYTPKHFGKFIYPRVVISNKFIVTE